MRIDRVPYPAVRQYLKKHDTVIIPLGSCEQQGPHLPMGTETAIVDAVATAVGEKTGFAVTPAMPINFAHLFLEFPGVLSARMDHYFAFLNDVCHGLASQGFRHFFFVNIHMGSVAPIEAAARSLRLTYPDAVLGSCECFQMMREASKVPVETDDFPYGHASERTTCMALYICPDLVDMKKAKPGSLRSLPGGFRPTSNTKLNYKNSGMTIYQYGSDLNALGCTGDPRKATAKKGEAIFNDVVAYAADLVTAFSKLSFVKKPQAKARA